MTSPEQPAELPEHDDSLYDAMALIECWSAVDNAPEGSEAERQATQAMGILLKHTGNAYATSLCMAKVLSGVRESFLACDHQECREQAPAVFRDWFTQAARTGE